MMQLMTRRSILAGYLVLSLCRLAAAADGDATSQAVNLVRDVPDARPRVTVDSSFAGYRPEVLTDGRWIAVGQEPQVPWGDPTQLGNGGNTWVSGEAAQDHWIRLDWPRPVLLNVIEIAWSRQDWQPRAVRIERLTGDEWLPIEPRVAAWEPTDRHCVIVTPRAEVQSLRILQPTGCGGARELLAAQEIAAYLRDGDDLPTAAGVQGLNAEELDRLIPKPPRSNIALLDQDLPGASTAVGFGADEARSAIPTLADGNCEQVVALPAGTLAVGIEWPIRHVVERATLHLVGDTPLDALTLEIFDEQTRRPVTSGLSVAAAGPGRVQWTCAPVATRGLRVRLRPATNWQPTELEVTRSWPAAKDVWPERLVERGVLARELLAGEADPTFEQVAAAALSMTPARTFVGTKDGRREIGVAWDGTIIGRDVLSFVIGQPHYRLADARETLQRELLDGWLPAVVTSARLDRTLEVCQTVFSLADGADPDRAATMIRLQLKNRSDQPLACPVQVRVGGERPGVLTRVENTLRRGDDVVLICRVPPQAVLVPEPQSLALQVTIPAQGETAIDYVLPHAEDLTGDELQAYQGGSYDQALARFRAGWDTLLSEAVKVELPEPRVQRMYRAVLAQLLINADGDIMPYGAAPSVYEGALFGIEESYAMLALAEWGLAGDAQRYLDATYLTPEFVRKVEEYRDYADRHQQYRNGLEPHYAVAAYRLSRDRPWITRHLPLLRECAEWTIAARKKTMQLQDGQQPLHWGLLPQWSYGGDIAEVECYALFANFCCWRGLVDTAWVLDELGDAQAARRYREEAAAYRRDIERAMAGSYQAAQTPPFLPLRLYATQPDEQMDYYQLFAGCILDVEFLGPEDPAYRWITDFMEADNRVFCGLPRFRRDAGPGGLDALYGKGYLLGKLREHAVREFLLGFYAYLAFNLDHTTFTSRETNVLYASDLHVRSLYPVPDVSDPVPCSSAVALHFLRHMLATELSSGAASPDTLLLLAGVPRHWLAPGNRVRFEQLPTVFGPTSVCVEASASGDQISADVLLPQREPAATVRLRLRHPEARPMKSVAIDGQPWTDVHPEDESIGLPAANKSLRVVVQY